MAQSDAASGEQRMRSALYLADEGMLVMESVVVDGGGR